MAGAISFSPFATSRAITSPYSASATYVHDSLQIQRDQQANRTTTTTTDYNSIRAAHQLLGHRNRRRRILRLPPRPLQTPASNRHLYMRRWHRPTNGVGPHHRRESIPRREPTQRRPLRASRRHLLRLLQRLARV